MTPDIALQQLRNLADRLHASGCHWRSERIIESADAIEAAMREKDEVIAKFGNGYAETGRVLNAKDAEIERLKSLWYADVDPIETEYAEDYRSRAALSGKDV